MNHMDIEDYHFKNSAIPYTESRTREECLCLMRADIERYGDFVLSAVTGDFGAEITALYKFAVHLSAPLELRVQRVKDRAYAQHGERVLPGGDMYAQSETFTDFVTTRDLSRIDRWAAELTCPILYADGTKDIAENAQRIATEYARL